MGRVMAVGWGSWAVGGFPAKANPTDVFKLTMVKDFGVIMIITGVIKEIH